jgi:predicted PurR-regulated permease PerM
MEKEKFKPFDNQKPAPFGIRWFSLFVAMFWAFFIAMALSNVLSPYLSDIISGLLSGITPLLIGIVVAFVFHRLVNFTENVVLKNAFKNSPYKFGIKRTISIIVVLLIIAAIFVLIFSILIPKIISVVQRLTTGNGDGWDQMVNNVVTEITSLIQRWFGADVDQSSVKQVLESLFDSLKETVFYIDSLLEFSMSVVTGAINFLMGMILAVLILKDKEKIARFSRRFVYANFKKERADEMCVMTANSGKILYDYVICKLIEFALLFVSLGTTYSLMGLTFTWELALIIGIFNFIPYFGIYIGAVPSILFTLIFDSMDAALYMALATVIVNTIVLNILVPIITGNKLKVSALVVTASIVLGGAMFGFLGMLLAPPIAAIISVIVMGNIELKENHMKYMMQLNESRAKSMEGQKENMSLPTDEEVSPPNEAKVSTLSSETQQSEKQEELPTTTVKDIEPTQQETKVVGEISLQNEKQPAVKLKSTSTSKIQKTVKVTKPKTLKTATKTNETKTKVEPKKEIQTEIKKEINSKIGTKTETVKKSSPRKKVAVSKDETKK